MAASHSPRFMPMLLAACVALLAACPSPTSVPLPRLSVATATLPDAVRGQPYSEAIHAQGGGHDVLYDGPILVLHTDGSSSMLGGRR